MNYIALKDLFLLKLASVLLLSIFFFSLSSCSQKPELPVFDVPHIDNIELDGDAADWGDRGFRVASLIPYFGNNFPGSDLSGEFRLAWNEKGLFVLVLGRDDAGVESENDSTLWVADCVELFLADEWGGDNMVQAIIAPGMDSRFKKARISRYDHRRDEKLRSRGEPKIDFSAKADRRSYGLEVFIPWATIGITGTEGTIAAFQLYQNDADQKNQGLDEKYVWYPVEYPHDDRTRMYQIRLSKGSPSAPVLAQGKARYSEDLSEIEVIIRSAPELIGKKAAVTVSGRSVTGQDLTITENKGIGSLIVRAEIVKDGSAKPKLDITIDEDTVFQTELATFQSVAEDKLYRTHIQFEKYVFHEKSFPVPFYQDTALVSNITGGYRLETVYLDKAGNSVEVPDAPGRYGAAVKVLPRTGKPWSSFHTLYHSPAEIDLAPAFKGRKINLGRDSGLSQQQIVIIQKELKEQYKNFKNWDAVFLMGPVSARIFCGASEYGSGPVDEYNDWWTRDRNWWVSRKRQLNKNEEKFSTALKGPEPAAVTVPAPVEGSETQAGIEPGTLKKLDDLLTEWAGKSDEGFQVTIISKGIIALNKAYGMRDGRQMTLSDRSRMASLSKLISGTVLTMHLDEGLIELNKPVAYYLPSFKGQKPDVPVTIEHAYKHTSGIKGHDGEFMHYLEQKLGRLYPWLESGARYEYAGTDMELVVKIMEQINNASYPVIVRDKLLAPLDINNTACLNASWNTMSTSLDMAKIGYLLLNQGTYGNQVFFRKETFKKMLPGSLAHLTKETTMVEYGLGTSWFKDEGLSDKTFGHGAASSATLRIDPEKDLVISMTRNSRGTYWDDYHPRFIKLIGENVKAED